MEGYRNLVKIVSKASTEGFNYKPRTDHDLLRQYSKGIIALSACIQGEVPQYILQDNMEGARRDVEWYIETFGKDNFFLEIQNHGLPEELRAQQVLCQLADEYGLGIVASNDFHYVMKDDADAQDIRVCIQTGRRRAEVDRLKFPNDGSISNLGTRWRSLWTLPGALENTVKIADRCNVEFILMNTICPTLMCPRRNVKTYLHKVCERNTSLIRRYLRLKTPRL
ncbi:MAG: PHP domain-containing protein [Veillonella sp.]